MSDPASKAVFLSYASQDAEAARRICEALRAAGVEVWFDQSELRGGDAWDAKIRKQIKECALFVPVISANTQARREGYFRREWKLAVDRTHDMDEALPFLVPVVIDDTKDAEAFVPEKFREVQWTRLLAVGRDSHGDANHSAFSARVASLLGSGTVAPTPSGSTAGRYSSAPARRRLPVFVAAIAAVGIAIAAWWRPWAPSDDVSAPRERKTKPVASAEVQRLLAQIAAIDAKEGDASKAEWALAETLAAQAVKLEPANAEAWAWYSHVAVAQFIMAELELEQAFATASQRARQALALSPESFEAQLALGRAYVMNPNTRAEADSILTHLTDAKTNDRRAWRARGTLARLLGRNEVALEFYSKADALPGGDGPACRELATLLSGLGRFDEAERAIERAIAVQPGPTGQILKINFLMQIRADLAAAGVVLENLPGSYFTRYDVVFTAVQVWRWQRQPAKIVQLLVGWPATHVGLVPKDYLLGEAYYQMGRPEAATQSWRAALAIVEKEIAQNRTTNPLLYHLKARFLARLGDKAASEQAARLWEQADPNKVGASSRAHLLLLLGKNDEALAALPQPSYLWSGLSSDLRFVYRFSGGAEYRYDPLWDPLRGNPRFEALVDAYRQRLGQSAQGVAQSAKPSADAKSIAVLAVRQQSADPENEYLCEAISDELCSVLGRVPGLKVAASASSFVFKKEKRLRPSEMAAQLGVAYLVDGRVQKIGSRVRVGAELIKAADESVVWKSDTLEHEVKDMFAVQDQVVAAIAKNLQLQLGATAATAVAINPEAYRIYYEGRRVWSLRGTPEEVPRAKALFQKALELDPNLGRAYAGLVDTMLESSVTAQGGDISSRFGTRGSEKMLEMLALATKAVELEPESAETHTARARALWYVWQTAASECEVRTALQLSPNHADAHALLARLLNDGGHMEEALESIRTATELDPLTSRHFDNFSTILRDAGRHREALVQAERALGLQPNSLQGRRTKMAALTCLGWHDEAVAIARQPNVSLYAGITFAHAGCVDEALKSIEGPTGLNIAARAAVLAKLGRMEEAMKSLTPELTSVLGLHYLLYQPELDPLRSDPRFVSYVRTLGITDAHARAQAWRAAHPPEKPEAKK